MSKNQAFKRQGIILICVTFFFWFFMAMLQADHMNFLMDYFVYRDWTGVQINAPQTWGGWAGLAMFIFGGTMFQKFGIAKSMSFFTLIMGVAAIGIMFSGGATYEETNYTLFAISLFTLRALVILFQLAGMSLITNWFIKSRGGMLGIASAGAPFYTAFGHIGLTLLTEHLGMYGYFAVALLLFTVAALTFFLIKDKPEDVGLYPDGTLEPPVVEQGDNETQESMTAIEIWKDHRIWRIATSLGLMMSSMIAIMGMNSRRFAQLTGPGQENLWTEEVVWFLTIGAIGGIIMSYVIGVVCDKYGGVKGTLLLAFLMFTAIIPLIFTPIGGHWAMHLSWAIGIACMTGGMSTVHPALIGYAYGRKDFPAAVKWVVFANSLLGTFAPMIMGWFFDHDMLQTAYIIIAGLVAFAIINLCTMLGWKSPDDIEERDSVSLKKPKVV